MNSLVRQSLRILLGRISISALSVLITIYFAYELPKNLFAIIVLYSTAASFTQVVIDLGLSSKIIREAPPLLQDNLPMAIDTILMPSTVLRATASIVTCVLMLITLQLVKPLLVAEFPYLNMDYITLIVPFCMMIENANAILVPLFQIKRLFGTDSVLTSTALLLENVFTLILYLLFGMNQYFLGILLAQLTAFGLRLFFVSDYLKQFNFSRWSWPESRATLKLYFPFYLRRFFRLGLLHGEQFIIAALLPLHQLANFNLAKRVSKDLKFYVEAFTNPLSIRLSKTRDLQVRHKNVRTFLFFTMPVPIVLALLSPWIMRIAGGEKYADNWPILAILYLSYIFYALSSLQFTVVTILGKHSDSLYRDAIGGTVGLIATLLLILIFAEYGLAWGQLIAYAALYIAGYHISKKYMHLSPEDSALKPQENTTPLSTSTKPVT